MQKLHTSIVNLWNKFSKNEKTFFAIYALLIIASGVFFQPKFYMQQAGQSEGLQNPLGEQVRNYTSAIIDLNRASIEELQTLPGIGPAKARAIVEYRAKSPFNKPEEIMNVSGIGAKTYEKIKDRIKIDGSSQFSTSNVTDASKLQTGDTNKQDSQVNRQININTADFEELQKLPNIGPVKAQAIIDYRNQNGGFKSIDEIKNVKGIGEKTFEKMKDLICVY
ncbi:MAG TPA: ComEA family DNA-binding protein [Fervidobacterium sp.]|nr:ComEA family DNA-binding protein [Fervidobacterium sp.]HOM73875.1 ComEA family DNA-binding protein [Fervidobacterium sp.]HOQ39137.1 ComEA family DNA-binding protein [Fervidobacterium sp.]HPP17532.1 ComEA family DNA-binding protein [Fervidobacterium sp.]HPT53663.1 ComEA family DNA-binding protein [Fervidobacterium sp.]